MRPDQGFSLVAAVLWGVLGSLVFGLLALAQTGDAPAAMTIAIACPVITVFLYLVFERLTAG